MRRLLAITTLVIGVGAVIGGAHDAQAQPKCDLRENFLRAAADQFDEAPVHAGVMADGRLFEVWATEDGTTWTALITQKTPDGKVVSCFATSGDNWRPVEAAPAGTGS